MNHTQRHWRATQLADAMDPFTLKEALHRAAMPFEYVHRAESRRLEREEEADKIARAAGFILGVDDYYADDSLAVYGVDPT